MHFGGLLGEWLFVDFANRRHEECERCVWESVREGSEHGEMSARASYVDWGCLGEGRGMFGRKGALWRVGMHEHWSSGTGMRTSLTSERVKRSNGCQCKVVSERNSGELN